MIAFLPLIPAERGLESLDYLIANGLTVAAIARRVKRSRQAVSLWVHGRHVPLERRPALEALRQEMEAAA